MKRLSIVLATLTILVVILGAVAFFFLKEDPGVIVSTTGPSSLPDAGSQSLGGTENGSGAAGGEGLPAVPVSQRLVKISSGPIVPGVGVSVVESVATSSPSGVFVSYIERRSGNVFSYSMNSTRSTRTSNRTLLGIQRATWLPDASAAVVQYLSQDGTVRNSYLLDAEGAEGRTLPENIAVDAVNSRGILSISSGVNGSVASVTRLDGGASSEAFSTPLSSVRAFFSGATRYLVFSKPSGTLSGAAFIVDGTGAFSRVAGPERGLSALPSPSGEWILISFVDDQGLRAALVDTVSRERILLPIATITDKCVWAPDSESIYCGVPDSLPQGGVYPDVWYQGAVTFADRLWRIHVENRYAQLLLDFSKETEVALDARALALDEDETALIFSNKNDDSLWVYSL